MPRWPPHRTPTSSCWALGWYHSNLVPDIATGGPAPIHDAKPMTRRERRAGGACDAGPGEGVSPVPVASGSFWRGAPSAASPGRPFSSASSRAPPSRWRGSALGSCSLADWRAKQPTGRCEFTNPTCPRAARPHTPPTKASCAQLGRARPALEPPGHRVPAAPSLRRALPRALSRAQSVHRLTPNYKKVDFRQADQLQCGVRPICGRTHAHDKYVTMNSLES
jgi:hypothetical protein